MVWSNHIEFLMTALLLYASAVMKSVKANATCPTIEKTDAKADLIDATKYSLADCSSNRCCSYLRTQPEHVEFEVKCVPTSCGTQTNYEVTECTSGSSCDSSHKIIEEFNTTSKYHTCHRIEGLESEFDGATLKEILCHGDAAIINCAAALYKENDERKVFVGCKSECQATLSSKEKITDCVECIDLTDCKNKVKDASSSGVLSSCPHPHSKVGAKDSVIRLTNQDLMLLQWTSCPIQQPKCCGFIKKTQAQVLLDVHCVEEDACISTNEWDAANCTNTGGYCRTIQSIITEFTNDTKYHTCLGGNSIEEIFLAMRSYPTHVICKGEKAGSTCAVALYRDSTRANKVLLGCRADCEENIKRFAATTLVKCSDCKDYASCRNQISECPTVTIPKKTPTELTDSSSYFPQNCSSPFSKCCVYYRDGNGRVELQKVECSNDCGTADPGYAVKELIKADFMGRTVANTIANFQDAAKYLTCKSYDDEVSNLSNISIPEVICPVVEDAFYTCAVSRYRDGNKDKVFMGCKADCHEKACPTPPSNTCPTPTIITKCHECNSNAESDSNHQNSDAIAESDLEPDNPSRTPNNPENTIIENSADEKSTASALHRQGVQLLAFLALAVGLTLIASMQLEI